MNTLLYLTDNSLEPSIADLCRRVLLREAGNLPIISVSHKPLDLGHNICIGEIGRSWVSIYRQILAGLEAVKTEWLCLIEHDCLYTSEHLNYQPSDPNIFYYNAHHWLVQWHGNHPELEGMYSYWPKRVACSQLICATEALRASTTEIMNLIEMGMKLEPGLRWHGEPGTVDFEEFKLYQAAVLAKSGRPVHWHKPLQDYLSKYRSKFFRTTNPNLDIRHGTNFTGPKRGKHRCYTLPYWGRFEDVVFYGD